MASSPDISLTDYSSDSSDEFDLDLDDISISHDTTEICTRQYGNIQVTLAKDDIVNQQVDVIVNVTAPNLDLNQGVASRALVTKGGDSIQQSVNTSCPNGIKEGDIAVSEAGNLSCDEIYHITMARKGRGRGGGLIVNRYVFKCLEKADNSEHSSIAFPALGTGKLGYNKKRVAQSMFDSVERYAAEHPDCSVDSVYFVIFPSDTETLETFKSTATRRVVDTSPKTTCRKAVGPLTIELVVGQLANQETDVIMTTATRGLDLSRGTLSKCVLDAAGNGLQTECKSKYPRGIQFGDIAKLGPGNISCQAIYMGAIPRHGKSTECDLTHEEIISNLVTKCLDQASSDGMTSVAFPTLGTGYLMYSPGVSAHYMLLSIKEFVQNKTACSITTVKIVVHGLSSTISKILRPFELELSAKPRPVPPPSRKLTSTIPARNTPEFCIYMYQEQITPPTYWTNFTSSQSVKTWKVNANGQCTCVLVDVDQNTFNAVEKLVHSTWEPGKIGRGRDAKGLDQLNHQRLNVTKVQRVENLNLLEQYGNKRQELFHEAGEDGQFETLATGIKHGQTNVERFMDASWKKTLYVEVNEGYFFHGTKPKNVQSVCKTGLDARMSQGESVFGQAIYMAESSTKADQYTDERNGRQKQALQMFLVRASLGKVCVMKQCKKLRRAPCQVDSCMSDTCAHEKRYHGLVAEDKFIFREFVVYDGAQVYPEYVITYDRE